jgi:hypothetical protein
LTAKLIKENSIGMKRQNRNVKASASDDQNDDWWSKVEDLDLSHQGIRKIHNLEKYQRFNSLFFLTQIETD